MKWLWIVPLILVGLVALVALIGLLLPKHHVATRAARFKAPPEKLWALIGSPEKQSDWAPGAPKVEMLPPRDGRPAWKVSRGRGDLMSFALVERIEPAKLVTRIIDESAFGGTWTWQLSPAADGGCTVRITEDGDIHNPVFRFVARFFMGYHGTIDAHLTALGKHLGESVVLE